MSIRYLVITDEGAKNGTCSSMDGCWSKDYLIKFDSKDVTNHDVECLIKRMRLTRINPRVVCCFSESEMVRLEDLNIKSEVTDEN